MNPSALLIVNCGTARPFELSLKTTCAGASLATGSQVIVVDRAEKGTCAELLPRTGQVHGRVRGVTSTKRPFSDIVSYAGNHERDCARRGLAARSFFGLSHIPRRRARDLLCVEGHAALRSGRTGEQRASDGRPT